MTRREMQIELERRIQLNDPEAVIKSKLSSDALFTFINEAIDQFWKTRYSGLNTKQEGFEQSQKRIDDLRTLIRNKKYESEEITANGNTYTVTLPEDYVMLLGDTAGIQPMDGAEMKCWQKDSNGEYIIKRGDTIESTIETIDRQLSNSLSEHKLRYSFARPLKLIQDDKVILYTDGNYKVSEYNITYLIKPSKINSSDDLTTEYEDLPAHTHLEIVKTALRLYSATKPTQNYNLLAQETQVME